MIMKTQIHAYLSTKPHNHDWIQNDQPTAYAHDLYQESHR